jgi:acetyl esterase
MTKPLDGTTILFQVLIYPPVDFTARRSVRQEIAGRATLTDERMEYFNCHYFRTAEDARGPMASPILADDVSGLPPALMITAEYDPLADEGAAYADKLRPAGVEVSHTCYKGMIHGFYSMPGVLAQATRAIDQVGAELRAAFGSSA